MGSWHELLGMNFMHQGLLGKVAIYIRRAPLSYATIRIGLGVHNRACLQPLPSPASPLPQYLFFACIYIMFPSSCMNESTKHFGHAFWFSFQTASTIGYSGDPGMYPNPDW